MGIKKKVGLIILAVCLATNVIFNTFVFAQDDMERYKELFKAGEYETIIKELVPEVKTYMVDRQKSIITESTIETARDLVADSYRMLDQYTNASDWYAISADIYFSSYARYCFEIFLRISILEGREPFNWKCVPFSHYDGRLGDHPENIKSLEWIFAKIFDDTSLEQKREYFKQMASYDKNNDWVTFLTRYYAGEITLEELFSSVCEEYMDIVCTYAGIILELEGKIAKARELYNRALSRTNSTNIEQLLAANRLGLFALKMIYTKFKNGDSLTDVNAVKASSTLFDGKRLYSVKGIFDDNPKTAWVEGKEDEGIGEWVEFIFDPGREIRTIKLINGYARSEEIYKANNRVKKIGLSFDGKKYPIEIEFKDMTMQPYEITLHEPIKARRIRITILDVYKGEKYNDTCISGISFNEN